VAQRGRGDRFVRWRTLTFCWTFDGHCRLPRKTNAEARLGLLLASVSRSLAEVARFGPSWIAVLRRLGCLRLFGPDRDRPGQSSALNESNHSLTAIGKMAWRIIRWKE
jgi:hypothetical protein